MQIEVVYHILGFIMTANPVLGTLYITAFKGLHRQAHEVLGHCVQLVVGKQAILVSHDDISAQWVIPKALSRV